MIRKLIQKLYCLFYGHIYEEFLQSQLSSKADIGRDKHVFCVMCGKQTITQGMKAVIDPPTTARTFKRIKR